MSTTYRQIYSIVEQDHGSVEIQFRVSDTYDGLFSAVYTDTAIFKLKSMRRKLGNRVGSIVENEQKLQIDEAQVIAGTDDEAALNFVLAARVATNVRFCALFTDTTDPPDPNDMQFSGVIQSEFEGDEFLWHGDHWDQSPAPKTVWQITAKPYNDAAIKKIKLKDLIYGNTPEQIPGIDSAWETANVADRQGYFYDTSDNRKTYVDRLVNLNALLTKLAANLTTALNNNDLGNISFVFDRSVLDGKYHPTRWQHLIYKSRHPRWIEDAHKVYADDYVRLYIDPNATDAESPWISYRLIKAQDDEPQPDSAKQYRWEEEDDFFSLLDTLAFNFCCFVTFTWDNQTTLRIKFVSRQSTVSQAYLKTAMAPQKKISANEKDSADYSGQAFYLARSEGAAVYFINNRYHEEGGDIFDSTVKDDRPIIYREATYRILEYNDWEHIRGDIDGSPLKLTLSPTSAYLQWSYDKGVMTYVAIVPGKGWVYHASRIPHNHLFYDGAVAKTSSKCKALGITTAIYLKVDKYATHPNASYEPASYWTPAAALTVNINGEDYQFDSMESYIDTVAGFDDEFMQVEYTLEIPFWFGMAPNADGSGAAWEIPDVRTILTIDGIDYSIVDVEWNLEEPKVKLTMHASARFDFDYQTTAGITQPTIPYETERDAGLTPIIDENIREFDSGKGTIYYGNVVAIRSDGLVEKAESKSGHQNKLFGFVIDMNDSAGEILISRKGKIRNPGWSWAKGKPVFLYYYQGGSFPSVDNLSQDVLTAKTANEDLIAVVGTATSADTIEYDFTQQPTQWRLT